MTVITLQEAQARLPELLDNLSPGDELLIVRDSVPAAKLIAVCPTKPRPIAGRGRGKLEIVSDDDEHLQDFAEYMP